MFAVNCSAPPLSFCFTFPCWYTAFHRELACVYQVWAALIKRRGEHDDSPSIVITEECLPGTFRLVFTGTVTIYSSCPQVFDKLPAHSEMFPLGGALRTSSPAHTHAHACTQKEIMLCRLITSRGATRSCKASAAAYRAARPLKWQPEHLKWNADPLSSLVKYGGTMHTNTLGKRLRHICEDKTKVLGKQ